MSSDIAWLSEPADRRMGGSSALAWGLRTPWPVQPSLAAWSGAESCSPPPLQPLSHSHSRYPSPQRQTVPDNRLAWKAPRNQAVVCPRHRGRYKHCSLLTLLLCLRVMFVLPSRLLLWEKGKVWAMVPWGGQASGIPTIHSSSREASEMEGA